MSRYRTIKPEYWTSEQVMSCSRDARLLFIGLWNFCDDAGIHTASYLRLKAEIFPGDNCTLEDIKKWILELIKAKLIVEQVKDDKQYWQVVDWEEYQDKEVDNV